MSEEASISLPGEDESLRVTAIKHHCDTVFVALSNGSLLLYRRGNQSKEPEIVVLGPDAPITCILPINLSLYVACGKQVFVMSAITGELQVNINLIIYHYLVFHLIIEISILFRKILPFIMERMLTF
jgi:hypothetical protein